MKKLMLIAIATMSLIFVSNTFGQAADWEIKPAVKKPKSAIKKPKQVQPGQNSGGTISNQRSSRKPKPTGLLAAGELLIHAVKGENKAQTSTGDQPELQRKKTRTRITQKRQHKP
jgi:hypothetical protein